jgi:hypothetical protein
MKTNRIGLAAAAVAVLVVAAPAVADQDYERNTAVAISTPPTKAEKAAELKREAEALFSQPKQWRKAIRLLERSASLRDANDPEGYMCLLYAGRIRAAIGDTEGARTVLEKAAGQALARGSVVEAVTAYIDAAHAAVAARDAAGARELVAKATLLAESPLLSAQDRSFIQARLST